MLDKLRGAVSKARGGASDPFRPEESSEGGNQILGMRRLQSGLVNAYMWEMMEGAIRTSAVCPALSARGRVLLLTQ